MTAFLTKRGYKLTFIEQQIAISRSDAQKTVISVNHITIIYLTTQSP